MMPMMMALPRGEPLDTLTCDVVALPEPEECASAEYRTVQPAIANEATIQANMSLLMALKLARVGALSQSGAGPPC